MMDQDGRPQGSTPPHPHRPRFTGVGFLEAGCRGAAPDGVSGVSPDFLPPSAPEGGVPKKPTFVNPPPPLREPILLIHFHSGLVFSLYRLLLHNLQSLVYF